MRIRKIEYTLVRFVFYSLHDICYRLTLTAYGFHVPSIDNTFDFISRRENCPNCLWLLAHTHIFIIMYHTYNVSQPTLSNWLWPLFFSHSLSLSLRIFFSLVNKRHPIFGCHLSSVFYLYWFTRKKTFMDIIRHSFLRCLSVIVAWTTYPMNCLRATLMSSSAAVIFLPSYCVVCLFMCVCLYMRCFFSLLVQFTIPLPFEISNK